MTLTRVLTCFSAVAFIIYGVLCVTSHSMVDDFRRFGLENLRYPTGYLEILGGLGLLAGLKWNPLLIFSSAGLSLMMLIAFAVRLRAHDSVIASLPSLLFALLNFYIFAQSLRA